MVNTVGRLVGHATRSTGSMHTSASLTRGQDQARQHKHHVQLPVELRGGEEKSREEQRLAPEKSMRP